MILFVDFSGRKKLENKLENFLEMDIFFVQKNVQKSKVPMDFCKKVVSLHNAHKSDFRVKKVAA
jgi:hypothetical protein